MMMDIQIIMIVFGVCFACIAGVVWSAKNAAVMSSKLDKANAETKAVTKQMEIIHEQKTISIKHAADSKRDSINSLRASKHRTK
jgi:mannitol-specific phosphotransferase system IIBC component